uniref:(northern house mosquito) hypothetical protein n=1 Tax=Culex pipiens TaxID=7175 RepID=A0A8D8GAA8_CULPI
MPTPCSPRRRGFGVISLIVVPKVVGQRHPRQRGRKTSCRRSSTSTAVEPRGHARATDIQIKWVMSYKSAPSLIPHDDEFHRRTLWNECSLITVLRGVGNMSVRVLDFHGVR